ncbi:MAG: hydrogenase maturation nickel metallochaperone HypA [Planctomycetota bacterium]
MHELSIAHSLVDLVTEHADAHGAPSVARITLRVGALSCVHKQSLDFSFDLAKEGTTLRDATLHYIDVPVAVYCEGCDIVVEPAQPHSFRCPVCGVASGDVVRGKELDIETIEFGVSQSVEA